MIPFFDSSTEFVREAFGSEACAIQFHSACHFVRTCCHLRLQGLAQHLGYIVHSDVITQGTW